MYFMLMHELSGNVHENVGVSADLRLSKTSFNPENNPEINPENKNFGLQNTSLLYNLKL